MNYLPLAVEFLGALLLVLSILISNNSLVIGATLAIIIYLVGDISGAHVNQAVSLDMYMKGSLTLNEFASYVGMQMLGGASSAYLYSLFV